MPDETLYESLTNVKCFDVQRERETLFRSFYHLTQCRTYVKPFLLFRITSFYLVTHSTRRDGVSARGAEPITTILTNIWRFARAARLLRIFVPPEVAPPPPEQQQLPNHPVLGNIDRRNRSCLRLCTRAADTYNERPLATTQSARQRKRL